MAKSTLVWLDLILGLPVHASVVLSTLANPLFEMVFLQKSISPD